MAKLYADADGKILRFLKTDLEEDRFPDPPPGTVETLDFDLSTNPAIGQFIDSDYNGCRYSGGQFRYIGAVQAINAPSGTTSDFSRLKTLLAVLDADQNLTAAQLRVVLRILIRWLLREMRAQRG